MSEKDYGATLNLPKTSFQMKANLPNKEPKIIQKWEENKRILLKTYYPPMAFRVSTKKNTAIPMMIIPSIP